MCWQKWFGGGGSRIGCQRAGKPLALPNVEKRVIVPALDRCEVRRKSESNHQKARRAFKRDAPIPEWRGWHAAGRGLGSNLYHLGVPELIIQGILRHANVSTTANCYIKTAGDDVGSAMEKLENRIAESRKTLTETYGTLNDQYRDAQSTIH